MSQVSDIKVNECFNFMPLGNLFYGNAFKIK